MPAPIRFQLPFDLDDLQWGFKILQADVIEGKEADFVDAIGSAAYLAGVNRQHAEIENSIHWRRAALKLLDNLPIDRQHAVVLQAAKWLGSEKEKKSKADLAVLGVVDELAAVASFRERKLSQTADFRRSSSQERERRARGRPQAYYDLIDDLAK